MRRIGVLVLSLASLAAQTAKEFEVASVKASELAKSGGKFAAVEKIGPAPNGVTMNNVSLLSCIRWAYDVKEYQVSGPEWLGSERYDIGAKTADGTPTSDLRLMMQTLLAQRFKLALHRDTRQLPVYALVVGKSGAKLEPGSEGDKGVFKVSGGNLIFQSFSMAELAERLSVRPFALDRPVIDQTGLSGRYDLSLKFADSIQELKQRLDTPAQEPAAFQESLQAVGLKLEPQKAPVPVLVIDHADKVPVGN